MRRRRRLRRRKLAPYGSTERHIGCAAPPDVPCDEEKIGVDSSNAVVRVDNVLELELDEGDAHIVYRLQQADAKPGALLSSHHVLRASRSGLRNRD